MKRPRLKLVLLAVFVYSIGILLRFPASIGASLAANQVTGFSAGGARGTIWNGTLIAPELNGRQLESVQWDFNPLQLFLLQAAADIDVRIGGETLSAQVIATPSGRLEIENLRGSLALAALTDLKLMPKNMARGKLLLDIESLALEDGKLLAASGRAQLTGLESMMLNGVALGDYAGTLENTESGIQLAFRDINAPLELAGTAQLSPDGTYQATGTVRPTDATPPPLRNGMNFLGQPDNAGRYRFTVKGQY